MSGKREISFRYAKALKLDDVLREYCGLSAPRFSVSLRLRLECLCSMEIAGIALIFFFPTKTRTKTYKRAAPVPLYSSLQSH
jgi:hypothetical protein